MKVLKSLLRKRTHGDLDAMEDISGKEILVTVFGANIIVRGNEGEDRKVFVEFPGRGTWQGDSGKIKEALTKMFPDASDKDITRGHLCMLDLIRARLRKMDEGVRPDGRRENYARSW
jgi:hypothetical protein